MENSNNSGPKLFGGRGWTLDAVWDKSSGQYFKPYLSPKLLEGYSEMFDRLANKGPPKKSHALCAIVDTGILSSHPMLSNAIENSIDFTGEGVEDKNGHGTIVALEYVTMGFFEQRNMIPRILNVKVMNKNKYSTDEWIAEGIRWSAENGANLINLSVGYDNEECHPNHSILCDAIDFAISKKCRVTVAAEATCPMSCKGVIAAGGVLRDGTLIRTKLIPKLIARGENFMVPIDYVP